MTLPPTVTTILTAGVDEAGRGPLAGPVTAAAVILHPRRRICGLTDSKLLSAEEREDLEVKIKERALAWAVGRYGGQAALHRWGRRLWLREHDLDKATAWFTKYGPAAVGLGRVLPVIRTFISLPAGIAGMSPVRFGIYTTLGCIPWTAALGVAGYAVGHNWQTIADDFHGPTYVIAGIVAVAAAAGAIVYIRRRKAKESAAPAGESGRHAAKSR